MSKRKKNREKIVFCVLTRPEGYQGKQKGKM
jgi:hypothetical protein